jgi:PAS domain S-box-containing protein
VPDEPPPPSAATPEHAFRALVEAMPDGAALVTPDGTIRYHNPRFAQLMTGHDAASLRGRRLRELVPIDAAVSIDAMLEHTERGPARVELGLPPRHGEAQTVQLTASAAFAEAEAHVDVDVDVRCVVATDLSQQRAQDELLREALVGVAARDRLISIAGHELRAPLQVLVSELGGLLTQRPAITVEQLASVQQLGFRLANLVASLLDVGLLGSDRLTLSLEELDLAELVRGIASRAVDLAGSGARVVVDARPTRGRWDRLRLEQVVTNLLSNAEKYGLGRPVRVVVDGDQQVARLVVEDRGIGIAHDAIERVFRPFERIGSVDGATGLGLGLYITAQIVKAHGGVIRVESDPGAGSRFIVELPYRGPGPDEP